MTKGLARASAERQSGEEGLFHSSIEGTNRKGAAGSAKQTLA